MSGETRKVVIIYVRHLADFHRLVYIHNSYRFVNAIDIDT